jgi:hypothetical protein
MPDKPDSRGTRKLLLLVCVAFVFCVISLGVTFTVQYYNERRLTAELERTQLELQSLGAQIVTIKDADLQSMNDYIGAYAQIEPLQNRYDEKLQKFIELYNRARERDSHRGYLSIQNFRGRHHPETWENMSEIISLVRQINEITKREGQVIHGMAALPEVERVRYWHEEFMPLATEEHELREKLLAADKNMPPEHSEQ